MERKTDRKSTRAEERITKIFELDVYCNALSSIGSIDDEHGPKSFYNSGMLLWGRSGEALLPTQSF